MAFDPFPPQKDNPFAAPTADLSRPEFEGGQTTPPAGGNPWLTMWTRPRATVRQILDTDPSRGVVLLAAVLGVSNSLDRAVSRNAGDNLEMPVILGMAFILGPLGGLLSIYIGGFLLGWAGRKLGGVGTSEQVRAALAWANVPRVPILALQVLTCLVVGPGLFRSEGLGPDPEPVRALFLILVGLVQIVLGIWSAVLAVRGMAEAHRFSSWRSLGASLLLIAVVAVPIVLIILAAVALAPR